VSAAVDEESRCRLTVGPSLPLRSATLADELYTCRFMALTDLITDIVRSGDLFGVDDATEHSVVEMVLTVMNDSNGEVKNLAVKA
jgi:hypothetical protein